MTERSEISLNEIGSPGSGAWDFSHPIKGIGCVGITHALQPLDQKVPGKRLKAQKGIQVRFDNFGGEACSKVFFSGNGYVNAGRIVSDPLAVTELIERTVVLISADSHPCQPKKGS